MPVKAGEKPRRGRVIGGSYLNDPSAKVLNDWAKLAVRARVNPPEPLSRQAMWAFETALADVEDLLELDVPGPSAVTWAKLAREPGGLSELNRTIMGGIIKEQIKGERDTLFGDDGRSADALDRALIEALEAGTFDLDAV